MIVFAGATRFELILTVLETVALPLNYTPIFPVPSKLRCVVSSSENHLSKKAHQRFFILPSQSGSFAGDTGVEPAPNCVTGRHLSRLTYRPNIKAIEPVSF